MSEPRFDVTTLGEVLLRLSVPPGRRLETATALDVHPGGSEANVAVALSQLGRRCAWVGALPATPPGRLATRELRRAGVNLERVVWQEGGRVGAYYVELALPPAATRVIYDRAGSCAAGLDPSAVDWDYLLDARLLHLSGITPALSDGCRQTVTEAIRRARAAGVAVSLDVNFRRKLWTAAEASAALEPLANGVELLFCSRADARLLFGRGGEAEAVAAALAARTGARCVVVSSRDEGVAAWSPAGTLREPARLVQVLDRPGAGDALAAGVIHGWLDGDLAKGLRYGVALSALALTQSGDALVVTPEEAAALAEHAGDEAWR